MFYSKKIAQLELAIITIEDRLDSFIDSPKKMDFTSVKIKYKDRKKDLIFCNRCLGTGKEDDRYGGKRECYLCNGKGYLRLKSV